MINEFARSDGEIPEGEDYITDTQWKDYVPTYHKMTGKLDLNTREALWKILKVFKVEYCVLKKRHNNNWNRQIEDRYRILLKEQMNSWTKIETRHVINFIIKEIDRIVFYQDSTLSIYKLPLTFPTGFMCQ